VTHGADKRDSRMSFEKEVFHNLKKTYDKLTFELHELFNKHGITLVQFDVLESIKNAGKRGLPLLQIGEKMISRQPDVTRIVDRLEDMGFVARKRDTMDRRVVFVKISRSGLTLCEELEGLLNDIHTDQFIHLSKKELEFFNHILVKIRGRANPSTNVVELSKLGASTSYDSKK